MTGPPLDLQDAHSGSVAHTTAIGNLTRPARAQSVPHKDFSASSLAPPAPPIDQLRRAAGPAPGSDSKSAAARIRPSPGIGEIRLRCTCSSRFLSRAFLTVST